MKGTLMVLGLISLIIGLASASFAIAVDSNSNSNLNMSAEDKAVICMNESALFLQEMQDKGFALNRINDSINEAEGLFKAQIILKGGNKSRDFSVVLPYCDEIKMIYNLAKEAKDELNAFKNFYASFEISGLDTSSIDKIVDEIEQEMQNERYEKVKPLVEKAYAEVINVKSSQTTLNLFYDSTRTGIGNFFVKNRKPMAILAGVLFLGLLLFQTQIRKRIIKAKIKKLELKEKTLKRLVMQTQKDYFHSGKMSEGMYSIRTNKFAELIRDIERQIPLLKEELARFERRRK